MYETEYFAPKYAREAVSLLSEHKDRARIVAGSTDLLARMKDKEVQPAVLINIRGISDLDYIDYDQAEGLKIGALTPVASIEKSPLIQEKCAVLARAAGTLGTPVIRRQATIGGNICNAAPSADTAPSLIVLGAKAKIDGADGE